MPAPDKEKEDPSAPARVYTDTEEGKDWPDHVKAHVGNLGNPEYDSGNHVVVAKLGDGHNIYGTAPLRDKDHPGPLSVLEQVTAPSPAPVVTVGGLEHLDDPNPNNPEYDSGKHPTHTGDFKAGKRDVPGKPELEKPVKS